MATLQVIRANIATDLKRSGLNTEIDKHINYALSFYEQEIFWFSEKQGTFNTVAAQQSYTTSDGVPSDILRIRKMVVTKNNIRYIVEPQSLDWIRESYGNTSYKGYPDYYALWADKIWLYPTPDAAYVVTLDYYQKFSDVSSDSDENDLMIYGQGLIQERAKFTLYTDLIEDDVAAEKAKGREIELLDNIRTKSSQYRATNQVRPWC